MSLWEFPKEARLELEEHPTNRASKKILLRCANEFSLRNPFNNWPKNLSKRDFSLVDFFIHTCRQLIALYLHFKAQVSWFLPTTKQSTTLSLSRSLSVKIFSTFSKHSEVHFKIERENNKRERKYQSGVCHDSRNRSENNIKIIIKLLTMNRHLKLLHWTTIFTSLITSKSLLLRVEVPSIYVFAS